MTDTVYKWDSSGYSSFIQQSEDTQPRLQIAPRRECECECLLLDANPRDRPLACPGRTPPLAQFQVGQAPAAPVTLKG